MSLAFDTLGKKSFAFSVASLVNSREQYCYCFGSGCLLPRGDHGAFNTGRLVTILPFTDIMALKGTVWPFPPASLLLLARKKVSCSARRSCCAVMLHHKPRNRANQSRTEGSQSCHQPFLCISLLSLGSHRDGKRLTQREGSGKHANGSVWPNH